MDVTSKIKIVFVTLIACSSAANESGLTALTDYDCGCPGQNASYICTANGGVITIWGGTAFNCTGTMSNEILLRHSDFQNAIGECNNGTIIGYDIDRVDSFFISRVDVRLSADLQRRTINCSVDNGSSVIPIGSKMLIVTTLSAPPPPPRRISTVIASPQEIIFSWDQALEYVCPTLEYNFTSENCGSCATIIDIPQTVNCIGFQTSTAGITCTFTVWSVVCENVTGPGSMRSAYVTLQVPNAPTVQSLPHYQNGRIQILIGLQTTFPIVVSPFVSSGINGSVQNYTVSYTDSRLINCGTANIPASSCVGELCSHNFDILTSSSCPPSTTVIVSVVATNVLGSSLPSTPVIIDGINNLVNVSFDPNQRTITCIFLNQPPDILKQCSANITYGENCNSFLNTFSGMDTGDTVETPQLEVVPGVVEYCFLVNATSNNVTVLVEGNLQNIDSSSLVNLIAAIVVPLVLVLLVVLLTVNLVVAAAIKFKLFTKLTVCITFSIKDKPGSLAKALKVFKDCKVNILGLNTHLHHADFDRNAGNGYKYNYIHCMCTREDMDFLKRELKAEIEGGNSQISFIENEKVPLTAIIKVKDCPGALWKAINKIGEHEINITGVNTVSDRESIPGYRDNYVKCCCSHGDLEKLKTELKLLTGREVNIQFFDKEHIKEKAIEYLVKDDVGALASTLQVITDLGINLSGLNLNHLPQEVNQTTDKGLKIHFIECSIDRSTKERLYSRLMRTYGAVKVEDHEVSSEILSRDPNYKIVKVTIHNEVGALNQILKGFRDLSINIEGVNILAPAFKREVEIPYKHYHLEITATSGQLKEVKRRILAKGLAIDIIPFDVAKYKEACQVNSVQTHNQSEIQAAARGSTAETDVSPTTKMYQFLVRNEVGALANALQSFSELGINITKVNPAHMSREHQDEFVECSCPENQRQLLIDKLKSRGAENVNFLSEKEVEQGKMFHDDVNYCVVKFSIGPEAGAIIKALKAFRDMRVKIIKVNPSHIKVYNQYVQCFCTEEEKTNLLTKLEEIDGVSHVHVTQKPETIVSERPTDDRNYCIIKYSVGEKAGTLVRALKVFFDLSINIIGVNTLNPCFERTILVKFKHNHVVLVATDDEEKKLRHELLVTGYAIDVKHYAPKHSDNLEPDNIAVSSI